MGATVLREKPRKVQPAGGVSSCVSCCCVHRAASCDAVRRTCMMLAEDAVMRVAGTGKMRCSLRVLTCWRIRRRGAAEAAATLPSNY